VRRALIVALAVVVLGVPTVLVVIASYVQKNPGNIARQVVTSRATGPGRY
jgi:hypothetical protein